jgi:uncharacterized secreted protein with C-terminal beta-propeller domain
MSDKFFADMASQMTPSDDVLADLDARLDVAWQPPSAVDASIAAGRSPRTTQKLGARRGLIGGVVAAVCAVTMMIAGLMMGGGSPVPSGIVAFGPVRFISGVAADYSNLYRALTALNPSGTRSWNWQDAKLLANAAPAEDALAQPRSAAMTQPMSVEDAGSVTATNTQVANIDEGDIVKTNGEDIFILKDNQIVIVAADGASTREISRIQLPGVSGEQTWEKSAWASEMMLYGHDTLVAIVDHCDTTTNDTTEWFTTECFTDAVLFDVSKPASPTLLATLGQSGDYNTSRLQGHILYLISNYYVAYSGDDIDAGKPETFVPRLTDGDNVSLVPPADIAICPAADSTAYTVVTSINLATRTRVGQEAVLGATGAVYMSANNLYLSGLTYTWMFVKAPPYEPVIEPTEPVPPTALESDPDAGQPGSGIPAESGSPVPQPTAKPTPQSTIRVEMVGPSGPVEGSFNVVMETGPVEPPTGIMTVTVTPGVSEITITVPPYGGDVSGTAAPAIAPSKPPDANTDPGSAGSLEPYESPEPFDRVTTDTSTTLVRIALADGQLHVAANTKLPGTILNQFAMDEYQGHLRVAINYTDTQTWALNSALYVLDSELQVSGKIDPLMAGESVQSVRFVGPVGYVVTFLQTDPLFALDLSNAAAPGIMSALKIPGFSSYLHPWGTNRLLGIGVQGDEAGLTGGMKLSVFDVSDPFALTETQILALDYDYSEAQYDHHAVLASETDGLVAFPATSCAETNGNYYCGNHYLVYRDNGAGFDLVATIDVLENSYQVRGMLINSNLYVWDGYTLRVHTSDTFARLAEVVIS